MQRGWIVKDNRIYFGADNGNVAEIPADTIISQALKYAHELEQIV